MPGLPILSITSSGNEPSIRRGAGRLRHAQRRERMSQVTITLNGRSYRLTCGDGEERRLLQLAEYVESRLNRLVSEFGQVGDERLLVMTSLMVADELFDAQSALGDLRRNLDQRISVEAPELSRDVPRDAVQPVALSAAEPPADAWNGSIAPAEPAGGPSQADSVAASPPPPVQPEPMLKRAIQQQKAEGRLSLEQRLAEARSSPHAKPGERKSGSG